MFRRLVSTAALSAVVLVCLSGCSGEGEAEALAPTSSPTTAAVTEPITEAGTVPPVEELYPYPKPEFPPEANEHSVLGAQAFTVYSWHTLVYAVAVRDPEPLQAICMPDVNGCVKTLELIEGLRDTNSYYLGYALEDLVIKGSMPGGGSEGAEWGTQLAGTNPAFVLYDNETGEETQYEQERLVFAAEVVWNDGWRISNVGINEYSEVYDE